MLPTNVRSTGSTLIFSTFIILLNFCIFFQESEIVEVLWKQDVDLGYSLSPPKPLDVKKSGVNADDDNEKLRALQELKDEKVWFCFVKKLCFWFWFNCVSVNPSFPINRRKKKKRKSMNGMEFNSPLTMKLVSKFDLIAFTKRLYVIDW